MNNKKRMAPLRVYLSDFAGSNPKYLLLVCFSFSSFFAHQLLKRECSCHSRLLLLLLTVATLLLYFDCLLIREQQDVYALTGGIKMTLV